MTPDARRRVERAEFRPGGEFASILVTRRDPCHKHRTQKTGRAHFNLAPEVASSFAPMDPDQEAVGLCCQGRQRWGGCHSRVLSTGAPTAEQS